MTRRSRSLLTAVAALCVTSVPLAPQLAAQAATGRIAGRIIDARTGQGVSDAGIQVVGTTLGTLSSVDGRYTIARVPAGTVTLQVRLLGYQPKTVTGLLLDANGALEQNIALEVATVRLQEQVVTAAAERGTVSEALDRQRTATGIVNAITSEQISRSPDSDAAAAVQRVSGVTVQDGKYVFVRGLGERYTTTALNGARLPSPEPERRAIPLDLFPSGLLQTISTSKTFTPDQAGDFSGAHVDIRTREFPARRQVTYSASVGYNDAASAQAVLSAPTEGLEWLGFGGSERDLPAPVDAAGNFQSSFSQAEINNMVRSFRNAWSAGTRDGAANRSFGVSLGGDDPFFGRRIGYVASLSYANNQEVRADERRALAIAGTGGQVIPINVLEGSTGRRSVLWGGLLNLSTNVGERTRIALNNSYTRTADNEASRYDGFDENLSVPTQGTMLGFVARSVRSNQVAGEHQIGDRHNLQWSLTSAGVTRTEPDRSEIQYISQTDPATGQAHLVWLSGSANGARRTFADLDEDNWTVAADYSVQLGSPSRQHLLKVGALARATDRDARNETYSIFSLGGLSFADRALPPEQIFDGRYAQDESDIFRIEPFGRGGSYTARDRHAAGYGMLEFALSERLRLVGGARIENTDIRVTSENVLGQASRGTLDNLDVLPSAALNIQLTDAQNLRISASQTLSRPEYRELSSVLSYDALERQGFFGNADLERTLIQNADVRWEWYPNEGEVLSVALFAKRFEKPIERVEVATSGTSLFTFVNADGADNYGVELEARKGLGTFADLLAPFTVFANATLMRSDIRTGEATLSAATNDERKMVGQAPYVVNAGVTYTSESGRASATALYNVVGERIVTAGSTPLPDIVEQPRHVLDLSVRLPVVASLSAKLDARNLLDEPYVVEQGTVVRERYTVGRVYSFGLTWRP